MWYKSVCRLQHPYYLEEEGVKEIINSVDYKRGYRPLLSNMELYHAGLLAKKPFFVPRLVLEETGSEVLLTGTHRIGTQDSFHQRYRLGDLGSEQPRGYFRTGAEMEPLDAEVSKETQGCLNLADINLKHNYLLRVCELQFHRVIHLTKEEDARIKAFWEGQPGQRPDNEFTRLSERQFKRIQRMLIQFHRFAFKTPEQGLTA